MIDEKTTAMMIADVTTATTAEMTATATIETIEETETMTVAAAVAAAVAARAAASKKETGEAIGNARIVVQTISPDAIPASSAMRPNRQMPAGAEIEMKTT